MAALNLLNKRSYTVAKLREKLLAKEFADEEIEEVLEQLQQTRYLNDFELCLHQLSIYIEAQQYSIAMIRQKLRNRGFTSETIMRSFDELACDTTDYEYATCQKFLDNYYPDYEELDFKTKQKIKSKLYRKGFKVHI